MQTVHVIWEAVKHERISDARELVGVVLTGWEDANKVVDALNAQDHHTGFLRNPYWKQEVDVLTLDDVVNPR